MVAVGSVVRLKMVKSKVFDAHCVGTVATHIQKCGAVVRK